MFALETDGQGTGLRLSAALQGRLEQTDTWLRESWLHSTRKALEVTAGEGLQLLRGNLVKAGLGEIEKTWRLELYPSRGLAWEPSALIFSKAEAIVEGFDEGATIRPRSGEWLWIPTPESASLIPRRRGPIDKLAWAFRRFGRENLTFVPPRPGRGPLIILEGGRLSAKTGRLNKAKRLKSGKFGKDVASFVLFFGVRQVTLPKTLDVRADFDAISDGFGERFATVFADELRSRTPPSGNT